MMKLLKYELMKGSKMRNAIILTNIFFVAYAIYAMVTESSIHGFILSTIYIIYFMIFMIILAVHNTRMYKRDIISNKGYAMHLSPISSSKFMGVKVGVALIENLILLFLNAVVQTFVFFILIKKVHVGFTSSTIDVWYMSDGALLTYLLTRVIGFIVYILGLNFIALLMTLATCITKTCAGREEEKFINVCFSLVAIAGAGGILYVFSFIAGKIFSSQDGFTTLMMGFHIGSQVLNASYISFIAFMIAILIALSWGVFKGIVYLMDHRVDY